MPGPAAPAAGRATTDRVMAKMRANLDRGAFYEAQQMLKTVSYRYRSRRMLSESYNVLEDGACLQLKQGQVSAPAECPCESLRRTSWLRCVQPAATLSLACVCQC